MYNDEEDNQIYNFKELIKIIIFEYIFNYNIIKLVFIIIILLIINIRNNEYNYIDIDNLIQLYEENINFSNYSTDIKTIALYLPQYHSIPENDKWWGKGFTEWSNVRKAKPLFKGQYQPRIPGDEINYLGYYNLTNPEVMKKQVQLAKNHGIYGFGIYYYWFSGKRLLETPLNILLNNKDINFKFLLIWANENWTKRWDGKDKEILIKQDYKETDPENFIKDIKIYLMDERYIKINDKLIIGIYEPMKIPKLNETLFIWRKKAKEFNIGELYIISTLNQYEIKELDDMELFDATYQFSPRDSLYYNIKNNDKYLYTATIYKKFNNTSYNIDFYKGSMLQFDNSPRKKKEYVIFENYSPEQFYILNKQIVEWTKQKYNNINRFIFINAWNEWGEGTYLEPDNKYGYASINALSKAIFNISYYQASYNITNLLIDSKIAIQAHIYYDDLIYEIINKIKNIPVKYDLFITTNNIVNKKLIELYIEKELIPNKYEILIVENKGRDILPLLTQFNHKIIKKYKYFCHIHSKKTTFTYFGDNWRQYLLENLLGSKEIISEILTDFENNDKLGFIFPEAYYKTLLEYGNTLTKEDRYYMNFLIQKIDKYKKIGDKIDFPIGNMFWAKVNSVYQIFEINIKNEFPKENMQIDGTIMHAIERIWLFLVKLNGYYYKKIYKHL